MNKVTSLLAGTLLATTCSLPVSADDYEPEQLIKYRQDSMEAIKGHNNAIKLILQDKVPFDDQLDSHVAALETLIGNVGTLFPEGSDFGETDAKDAIWDNPEKFEEAVNKAQQALADFKTVLAKGDKQASASALKQFGKDSCGNCHKSFKKKDD